jgi:hypothetical protein
LVMRRHYSTIELGPESQQVKVRAQISDPRKRSVVIVLTPSVVIDSEYIQFENQALRRNPCEK